MESKDSEIKTGRPELQEFDFARVRQMEHLERVIQGHRWVYRRGGYVGATLLLLFVVAGLVLQSLKLLCLGAMAGIALAVVVYDAKRTYQLLQERHYRLCQEHRRLVEGRPPEDPGYPGL